MYVHSRYMYVIVTIVLSVTTDGSLRCHPKDIEIIALLDCNNSKAVMIMVFRCVI